MKEQENGSFSSCPPPSPSSCPSASRRRLNKILQSEKIQTFQRQLAQNVSLRLQHATPHCSGVCVCVSVCVSVFMQVCICEGESVCRCFVFLLVWALLLLLLQTPETVTSPRRVLTSRKKVETSIRTCRVGGALPALR